MPLHGLVYSKDRLLTYFIKRFDRRGSQGKVAIEDFAQLGGASRDTKYDSSMEQVVEIINRFCTFPVLDKIRLFERTLFSFLTGNEDMHLKNFSVITRNQKVELSPAYDLLNTTITSRTTEELALPLKGKKKNLTKSQLFDYFAIERLEMNPKKRDQILEKFSEARSAWQKWISRSFLPDNLKEKYQDLLANRMKRLGL